MWFCCAVMYATGSKYLPDDHIRQFSCTWITNLDHNSAGWSIPQMIMPNTQWILMPIVNCSGIMFLVALHPVRHVFISETNTGVEKDNPYGWIHWMVMKWKIKGAQKQNRPGSYQQWGWCDSCRSFFPVVRILNLDAQHQTRHASCHSRFASCILLFTAPSLSAWTANDVSQLLPCLAPWPPWCEQLPVVRQAFLYLHFLGNPNLHCADSGLMRLKLTSAQNTAVLKTQTHINLWTQTKGVWHSCVLFEQILRLSDI